MAGMTGEVRVRRSADRFVTSATGRETRHSFSFGDHYDPADTGHGLLLAHNDDRIAPGHGYPRHAHADVEILTWVLGGALRHEDSRGTGGLVTPGTLQRMGAGSGVEHAEWNDTATGAETHFVQMWVQPREPGLSPAYDHAEVPDGDHVVLASGLPRGTGPALDAVVGIAADAALHLLRPAASLPVALPDAPYLHVFVTRGRVLLEDAGVLETGDAVRLTGAGARRLEVAPDVAAAGAAAEVLAWEMWPPAGRR